MSFFLSNIITYFLYLFELCFLVNIYLILFLLWSIFPNGRSESKTEIRETFRSITVWLSSFNTFQYPSRMSYPFFSVIRYARFLKRLNFKVRLWDLALWMYKRYFFSFLFFFSVLPVVNGNLKSSYVIRSLINDFFFFCTKKGI